MPCLSGRFARSRDKILRFCTSLDRQKTMLTADGRTLWTCDTQGWQTLTPPVTGFDRINLVQYGEDPEGASVKIYGCYKKQMKS